MANEAQQEGTAGSGAVERQAPSWPPLGQMLAGLAGVGVLVTGAAFVIGWRYTAAFYDRLGIPTRALDLEPADYLTAKMDIWYALAVAALSALMALLMWRYGFVLTVPPIAARLVGAERFVLWVRGGSALVALAAAFAGTFGMMLTGNDAFLYVFAMGATFAPLLFWNLMVASAHWRPVAVGAAVILAVYIAVGQLPVVATALGHHDAEALLAGRQHGNDARLVAADPLGLPGERHESGTYVTEAVALVTATNNAYFVLVPDSDTVYCVQAARVLRIEYNANDGG